MNVKKETQGHRIFPNKQGVLIWHPGDYGQALNGEWMARPPDRVSVGSLRAHKVKENPDGTITVEPSILVRQMWKGKEINWHGYLIDGIWKEV